MNNRFIVVVLVVAVVLGVLYFTSLKAKNETPIQATELNTQEVWQEQTVDEIGLSFKYPKDLVFRKEIADDGGTIRTVGFFLTKGPESNPEYQLYGLFQQFKDATEQDLELSKTEMDPDTIKDATIDGYSGMEGLILGEKTRYITIVLKDGKNFSVSTTPPTSENKELTDKIIKTFDFQ
ncbi:MAG: hypothetical protein Q8P26_00675 [Candidatus Levybacteria bacterium]|nr:hypothetical protein [Candidatus Levybacteria bacterium]